MNLLGVDSPVSLGSFADSSVAFQNFIVLLFFVQTKCVIGYEIILTGWLLQVLTGYYYRLTYLLWSGVWILTKHSHHVIMHERIKEGEKLWALSVHHVLGNSDREKLRPYSWLVKAPEFKPRFAFFLPSVVSFEPLVLFNPKSCNFSRFYIIILKMNKVGLGIRCVYSLPVKRRYSN